MPSKNGLQSFYAHAKRLRSELFPLIKITNVSHVIPKPHAFLITL